MLSNRMWGTSAGHCCLECATRPPAGDRRGDIQPAFDELCEKCQSALLADVAGHLLELEARIVESKTTLRKNAEARALYKEAARAHIDLLKSSLLVLNEYRAILLP